MKRCVRCAEKIQGAALACRYCGSEQPKRESKAVMILVIIAVLVAFGVIGRLVRPAPETEPQITKTEKPRDPRDRCVTGLNGEIYNVSGQIERALRNPPSFKHVRTVPGPIAGDIFPVTTTYRATNGFGAVDTAIATGEVRTADCSARITRLQ